MKVKNTIPIPVPYLVEYATDDCSLSILGLSKQHTDIVSIESDTMRLISRFPVEAIVNHNTKYCLDDNCLYLPTKLGQILAIDKFSGEILETLNTAMPIVSDLFIDDENIYCVCGVPISRQWKLMTDNFCICIFDKETGVKKIQTNYFTALPIFLNISENIIMTAGVYLLKYSKNGEFQSKTNLGVPMDYSPLVTSKHISCVSTDGVVRILNTNDLSRFAIVRAPRCESVPILINDEEIAWFTTEGICRVKIAEQKIEIEKFNKNVSSSVILNDDKLFGCDNSGSLIQFDLKNNEMQSIKLSDGPLKNPVQVDNYLFVASTERLHQIEIGSL